MAHVTAHVALACEPPPERLWQYLDHAFIETQLAGVVVAELIRGKPQKVSGIAVLPQKASSTGNVERHASRRRGRGGVISSHPGALSEVRAAEHKMPQSQDLLLGDGPTFLSIADARAAFFYASAASNSDSGELWLVSEPDRRGRIDRVQIGPTAITVVAKGDAIAGLAVQLSSPTVDITKRVPPRGVVRFRTPSGMPANSMLSLRTDEDWIDYRYFPPIGAGTDDDSIVWEQPDTELDALLAGGEGLYTEFKRQFPRLGSLKGKEGAAEGDLKRKILKTVVAFAAGAGGTILFGVDDDATVVGVDPTTLDVHEASLTAAIRSSIEPHPPYAWRHLLRGSATVALLEVTGTHTPHAYAPLQPEFYIRAGGTTVRARPSEIRDLFVRGTRSQSPF